MKLKIYIIMLLCSASLYAQQEPHYTQYMYNMNIINPAYMINEPGLVEVGALYRSQWVGIDGAPKTGNVFANIPLSDRIEISINYLNDEIGQNIKQTENVFNVDAAYKMKINETLDLSFGMKAGFDHLSTSFNESNVSGDPLFANTKKTVLNIGAGVFLFQEKYYVGLSAPNLLPNEIDANDEVQYQNKMHLFLIAGYVFDINDDLKLKPSTVVKQTAGAPLSFDISANALFKEKFELGVSYRYQDAITAMAGIEVLQDLRIGYAYDFNTSALKTYNNGSHEFLLTYRFDVLGLSKKYSSPRFY
ncbi:type IX secretion system membrane protein PorP/SprF [Lacinutrix sp. WUR7]|uniref:PorP/SprF family type IX secretion system membrane protein n=1 Tax=Lacinutrix sp. WUR7 TaxID=2653681 RepID=UPI00193DC9B1|nr:type IX secretion system membrane protein PorP/SprF [Lacinutrix sp. WUR7]QRM88113.1 type IX secretion system membrane protein PorP/SprF [Lacinutrix sp. WUR7]